MPSDRQLLETAVGLLRRWVAHHEPAGPMGEDDMADARAFIARIDALATAPREGEAEAPHRECLQYATKMATGAGERITDGKAGIRADADAGAYYVAALLRAEAARFPATPTPSSPPPETAAKMALRRITDLCTEDDGTTDTQVRIEVERVARNALAEAEPPPAAEYHAVGGNPPPEVLAAVRAAYPAVASHPIGEALEREAGRALGRLDASVALEAVRTLRGGAYGEGFSDGIAACRHAVDTLPARPLTEGERTAGQERAAAIAFIDGPYEYKGDWADCVVTRRENVKDHQDSWDADTFADDVCVEIVRALERGDHLGSSIQGDAPKGET